MIDYYGVTFDHLVPVDDTNPEVLQINIIEIEDDAGVYAKRDNKFVINPADYIGKQVLGAPRCCSTRKGTSDRKRVNDAVDERMRNKNVNRKGCTRNRENNQNPGQVHKISS